MTKQTYNPCELPLAQAGLTSYRYKGTYGWIMIGAHDHTDALKQAGRSTDAALSLDNLQVWTGTAYTSVSPCSECGAGTADDCICDDLNFAQDCCDGKEFHSSNCSKVRD